MPMLTYDEALPRRPHRVLVAGTSGSGKTTLSSMISATLHIPHVEIDGLYHGPNWTPRGSFRAEVETFAARDSWVTEWQYSTVRALLTERADLLVWLDLPVHTVMRQVIARTLVRRWRRVSLWNGNLEPPLRTILTDKEHIIRWAWDTRHKTAARIRTLDSQYPGLPVVRLRSRRQVRAWLAGQLSQTLR